MPGTGRASYRNRGVEMTGHDMEIYTRELMRDRLAAADHRRLMKSIALEQPHRRSWRPRLPPAAVRRLARVVGTSFPPLAGRDTG
jgi:hypothetical protein